MQELPPGFRVVGAPQSQGDPVIAPPDPYKQRADVRAERTADRGDAQFQYQVSRDRVEDERKAKEELEKGTQAQAARGDAVSMLSRTLEKIRTVKTDVNDSWTGVPGLGETGMSGAMQGGILGSPAYSLRKDLGTIDSTQVLQAMTRLKELSPTGSTGFGALSAPELELLKSSVARLDPNMDQATFMANLETAEKVYQEMLDRIESEGLTGPPVSYEGSKTGVPDDIAAIMAKYGAQ